MRKKIGECLIQAGLITEEDLRSALAEHKRTGERLGVVLVRMNLAKVALIPVDARNWDAHMPTDAPAVAKNLLARLRGGG